MRKLRNSLSIRSKRFFTLQKNKPLKQGHGFTIIELLIVIVVIAILAGVTIVAYRSVTKRSRDSAIVYDLQNGNQLLSGAVASNGVYPADLTSLGLKIASGNTYTYNVSPDYLSFCLQESGSSNYFITNTIANPQTGTCSGTAGVPSSGANVGPTVAASSIAPIGSGTGLTISNPVPSGTKAGSLIILHVFAEYYTATAGTTAALFTVPSNFTLAYSLSFADNGGGTYQEIAGVYYGYALSTDTSYSIGIGQLGGQNADGVEYSSAARITGATATSGSPFVDSFKQYLTYYNQSNNFTFPSFTTGGNNSLLYIAVSDPGNITGTTYGAFPTGWTKTVGGTGNGSYGVNGFANQASAGATGDIPFTSDRNDGKYTIMATIR